MPKKPLVPGDIVYYKTESWPSCKKMILLDFNSDSSQAHVDWMEGQKRMDKWVHPSTLTSQVPDPAFVPTVLIVGALLLIGFLGFNLHKIATRPPDPQIILPATKRVVECGGEHHPKTIMISNGESTIYYEPETNVWRHGNFKAEEADYFVQSKHGELLTVNGAAIR